MEVLLADAEVERRQQHLSADDPVAFQQSVVHAHEAALSDGRHRLQGHRITWAARAAETERRQTRRDRTGRDRHDSMPGVAERCELPTEPVDRPSRRSPLRRR